MSELTDEEKRILKNTRERENWKKRRMKILEELGLDPNRPVRADGKRGELIYPSKRSLPEEFRIRKEGESEEEFKKRRQKEVARRYNEKHKERLGIERRAHYAANIDHCREVKKKWELANPEKRKIYSKDFLDKNPDRLEKLKQWRKDNPDIVAKVKEMWYKDNPHINGFYASNYRAAQKEQTPSWADLKRIDKVFRACYALNKQIDVAHHVDHIVPLRGKNVSGLHVHYNLRIITAVENVKKRARLDEAYIISLMKRDWEAIALCK